VSIHINDPATVALVEQLTAHTGQTRTRLVFEALLAYRDVNFPGVKDAPPNASGDLMQEVERVLRAATLNYQREQAKRQGKKTVGSRVYKMIADNGVMGTLRKLVERPTEGLKFLIRIEREDLAAENIVLDPRFSSVMPDDLKKRAKQNLRVAHATAKAEDEDEDGTP
jgi:hypothetical protein